MSSVQLQQGSLTNPSRGQKFTKRSERQAGTRSSRKLSENNRNSDEANRMNSMAKDAGEVGENQGNSQGKRNNFASKDEEDEKEMKRSVHPNSALATLKSNSLRVGGSKEAVKLNPDDEELDENSEDYDDEAAEEDDEAESDSDKDNEYDEFEGQEMRKRETQESNAEDYEDCERADEESGQGEERKRGERFDGRVKRDNNEAEENRELSKSEGLEDPMGKSKREEEPEAINSETETPNESAENSSVQKEVKLAGNPAEGESADEEKSGKNSDVNSAFENRVEEEIQQKIDSIKEEIKRAVEEREKIREIEINNAKFDELQSEAGNEDENEESQNLEAEDTDQDKHSSKRSSTAMIRADKLRAKRSASKDLAYQLRAVEGVEKLDPDVFSKAQLRHESIKKRSAPIFGAIDSPEPLRTRSFSPRQVYLSNKENDDVTGLSAKTDKAKRTSLQDVGNNNLVIIPEQAKVKIEDDVPVGFSLDPSVPIDSKREISKGNPELIGFTRRRRASAVIPEGRVAFLGYRPDQDEGDDDEGGEFEDDGFQDRTSNIQEEKSYYNKDGNRANYFLFPGLDRANNEDGSLVRRKRAGSRGGGATVGRRRARGKAKQLQNVKIASRKKNLMDRDKRQARIYGRSENVASLVGSTQELSPRLATEYKEAFGGLQSDPGGALARFKRVKRGVIRAS